MPRGLQPRTENRPARAGRRIGDRLCEVALELPTDLIPARPAAPVPTSERTKACEAPGIRLTHDGVTMRKHGGKTIILARFIPIVRTFAPIVAGVGSMSYKKFISYNVIGGIIWCALFVYSGYYFGNLSFVKNNFSVVLIAIVVISVLPAFYEFFKHKFKKNIK